MRELVVTASNDNIPPLGNWEGDDLKHTVHSNMGVGYDADLPPSVRFIAGVAKLLKCRKSIPEASTDPKRPAVFLLEANARSYDPEVTPERVPMLDTGSTAVTGRLWFVSPVVVDGKYIALDNNDDGAIFRMVTDVLKLGSVPAIIYDPRNQTASIRYYPRGLCEAENLSIINIYSTVSLQEIYGAIDQIYQQCLITPEAQDRVGKLWKDNDKWWPSREAEGIVQMYLRAGLTTAFPTCIVRHEQTGVAGRLDLLITESDPQQRSNILHHAVLELKVLRSFRSTGTEVSLEETLDWIKSGVEQAASYRDDFQAKVSCLCCFDMRKNHSGEQCFEQVRDRANHLRVELKLWFIFSSSNEYRKFKTSGIN